MSTKYIPLYTSELMCIVNFIYASILFHFVFTVNARNYKYNVNIICNNNISSMYLTINLCILVLSYSYKYKIL